MCNKVISEDPFMRKHCLDRYKTQEMCDKAVDDFLPALKFFPGWFVTKKMVKKLDDDLFCNDDIIFVNKGFNNVTFLVMKWIFLVQILIILTLMIKILIRMDDPETIIHIGLMVWRNRFKQRKACKKEYKQRINAFSMTPNNTVGLVHARRQKKEIEPFMIDK